jgi:hypothetical protein
LSQSLENFGFDALYHSTGPPYSINLNIQEELALAQKLALSNTFATDVEFQEYMQSLFQKTIDAHTRYSKPYCYNTIFVQPFAFDMRVENATDGSISNEPKLYLMRNLYTDLYSTYYPELDLNKILDKEVSLINGVEPTTEISEWGDTHETRSNNRGIRFNAAIRSYLYRNALSISVLPLSDLVLTMVDGDVFTIPWIASYKNGFGDISVCTADTTSSSRFLETSQYYGHPQDVHLETPQLLNDDILHATRTDREVIVPSTNPYFVSCFVQTVTSDDAVTAEVSKVLVMKVSSFSPDGYYLDAWSEFLNSVEQCLSVDYDMIVVDVMQNGGGYVCLGLRLIELLVEDYENDHVQVQMNYDLPHSKLMDRYIEVVNAPNPYPYPQAVEQILDRSTQKPFPDGRSYYYPGRNVTQGGVVSWRTNYFSLDCTEAEAMPSNGFRPAKFMPPEKLIILTDGTCGSTCASFTKIPQEHGKATFYGAGGLWDQGMDVSSFAGGFVCNPDYLYNISVWSNSTFPKFVTDQRWQFGWATWYSSKLPSRAIQFTVQDPDYREAFWGFPHASISSDVTTEMVSALYDRVITSTLSRLAAEVVPIDSCSDSSSKGYLSKSSGIALIVFCTLFGIAVVFLSIFVFILHRRLSSYKNTHYANEDSSLGKSLLVA